MKTIRKTIRTVSNLFAVRREELPVAVLVTVLTAALNTLVIVRYYAQFTPLGGDYWNRFIRQFHISGFDPITLCVVSDWNASYNVFRHPLLAFYMYVPYLLNRLLSWLTGINCAVFVVAALTVACSLYAALFFRRTLREVVGLGRGDSSLLTFLLFSFAYVMLPTMVPDHFIISMMLILLTLYVAGLTLTRRITPRPWHTVVLFVLTAGVSLNNGLKVFLAALFVRGRRFFRPGYLLAVVLLPAALMWGAARVEYAKLVWPREMARNAVRAKARKAKADEAKRKEAQLAAVASKTQKDSARAAAVPNKDNHQAHKRVRQGRPISGGEFMRWTDVTTSRTASIVDNLFGESIQLHRDHLLEDEYRNRPMFVGYRSWTNYAVEAVVVLLFAAGAWVGRKSRFFLMAFSCFALDMLLHVVLGFGLNEVYIMTAHWAFVIPLSAAFLIAALPERWRPKLRVALLLLVLYLWTWNASLIASYLL